MQRQKLFGCFDTRLLVEALLAAVAVMACAAWQRGFAIGSAPRIALAVVEGGAFGFIIARTLMSLRRLDELGQRIHFEAITLAFAATGIAIVSYDLLARAGGLPAVRWGLYLWPLMSLFWLAGLVVVGRRYR